MNNERDRLRAAVRTQEAVVRTMTDELQRKLAGSEGLRAQMNAESARLVSTMEDLSRARPPAATGQERAPSHSPRGRIERRFRVLLVDDDDDARNAIASWLAQEYEVFTACDGAEGLVRAQDVLPDAIIAAVQMPRLDGIAMARRIRALRAPVLVPVIFLNRHSAPENVTAGFSAGGVGYLIKPVNFELLDNELRWALGGSAPPDAH